MNHVISISRIPSNSAIKCTDLGCLVRGASRCDIAISVGKVVSSRDSRSSRLAEATQKPLGTIALSNWFRCMYLFIPHIYPTFTKSFY